MTVYNQWAIEYEIEQAKKEMHLPYWERTAYKSYKQIKVVQPQLETPINDYINIKIEEQEKGLVSGALTLKKNLKAIDELPHNGIMSDMITLTHQRCKDKNSQPSLTIRNVGSSQQPTNRAMPIAFEPEVGWGLKMDDIPID